MGWRSRIVRHRCQAPYVEGCVGGTEYLSLATREKREALMVLDKLPMHLEDCLPRAL